MTVLVEFSGEKTLNFPIDRFKLIRKLLLKLKMQAEEH